MRFRPVHIILGSVVLSLGFLFGFHYFHFQQRLIGTDEKLSKRTRSDKTDTLIEIIKLQNTSLANLLDPKNSPILNKHLQEIILEKEIEIARIQDERDRLSNKLSSYEKNKLNPEISSKLPATNTVECISSINHELPPNKHEEFILSKQVSSHTECEARYGMELISRWRESREIWCDSKSTNQHENLKSELACYPYTQQHKKRDGRGSDMFCVATNFVIDFSKISGAHRETGKAARGQQYHSFQSGSLTSSCTRTNRYRPNLFMNHHHLQMQSFLSDTPPPPSLSLTHSAPVYLLARDEDCENSFHSTADFMNMFLVLSVLQLTPEKLQVMLFDRHSNGPYLELIKEVFSPSLPLLRASEFSRKTVLFKKLIFHLESPAGLIFPKISNPDPMRCFRSSFFDNYRKFVLKSFNLLDIPPPSVPSVLLSLRHRTPEKNVGRVLGNEQEVISLLKEGNMMSLQVLDTAKMSYRDQLKAFRSSSVIVGVHGAGLMLIMFAAEEAVLVEIHPSYRQDRHFRHTARLSGKMYMPVRAISREKCVGSSDTVIAPLDELRKALDGALRLARSFDDGLAECGLVCPPSILAIDSRLDREYSKHNMRKGQPLNLQFPCY